MQFSALLVNIIFGGEFVKKKRMIFGTVLILSLICLLVCAFYPLYNNYEELNEETKNLQNQITEQKEYSKELEKTEEEYSTDEYVEKHARSLGLVKPDEKIFRNYNDKK